MTSECGPPTRQVCMTDVIHFRLTTLEDKAGRLIQKCSFSRFEKRKQWFVHFRINLPTLSSKVVRRKWIFFLCSAIQVAQQKIWLILSTFNRFYRFFCMKVILIFFVLSNKKCNQDDNIIISFGLSFESRSLLSTLIDIPQVLVIVVAAAYIRGQGFGGYNSGGFGDGGSTFDTEGGGKRSPLQPEGENLLQGRVKIYWVPAPVPLIGGKVFFGEEKGVRRLFEKKIGGEEIFSRRQEGEDLFL